MNHPTCATCAHWTRSNKRSAGTCRCPAFVFSHDDEEPPDRFRFYSDDADVVDFETGEAFGCVHHHTAKP